MNSEKQPDPASEPISKSRLRLWLSLLKTSSMIEDEIRRRLRSELDWTLPRFDVMSTLSRRPEGLKMSEISKMLRVSNGNITGIVDRLTHEGLVLRIASPSDRRANLVRLTPKGEQVFAEHATTHEAWIDEILSGLNANDIEGMMSRLDHLAKFLESQD
ncbi:MarR family winged helix-turn-helix transcriptional regulator [Ruegeria lacuscaerulensis]|uniref:MarR family winged helix-turn-helix transcriptional regulator n=1 Tax=Ruegeria lacuscaerulensis TaxID=55218 RepID=UPI00147A27D2|nr:MarR family transcriptional regulator [Ruegeria lacuscaerulensis]